MGQPVIAREIDGSSGTGAHNVGFVTLQPTNTLTPTMPKRRDLLLCESTDRKPDKCYVASPEINLE